MLFKRGVALVLGLASLLGSPYLARAADSKGPSKAKIMVLTSTYGVMAGTLTGFASLAFYKSPDEHVPNVAKAASIGLYMGILLGAYLIYFVPDPSTKKDEKPKEATQDEEASVVPQFVPYLGYNEKTKSSAVGFSLQF